MPIKEFSIVYDDQNKTWVATHKGENSKKIFVCGDTPVQALAVLIKKMDEIGVENYDALEKAALVMDNIVKTLNTIDDYGDPLIELTFEEGMVGSINGELLGYYTRSIGDPKFVLTVVEGMEVAFKIKLFNDKQISHIEMIDKCLSYQHYADKYADILKEKGL